jgi:hypothetical protein
MDWTPEGEKLWNRSEIARREYETNVLAVPDANEG